MLKVGICGCGSISEFRHIPEYADRPDVVLAGYFDTARERAEKSAQRYGGKVYDTAQALLLDPAIDAVSICSSNKYHYEQVMAALKAGKHVLCEKPMATDTKKAAEMNTAAEKAGKKLMIAENFRVAPAHLKAKKLVEAGEIGNIQTFRAVFGHRGPEFWSAEKKDTWFFKKDQCFVGCTGDLGIHKIELLRWLLGSEVKRLAARIATLEKKDGDGNPIGVEDNAVTLLEFDSGIFGTLAASWTYQGDEDHSTVLYGSEGTMKIYDHPQFPITVTRSDGEKSYYETGRIPTNDAQFKTGIIDAFVDCVINDTPPLVSGRDGMEDLRVVETILRAAQSGQWEENK